MRFLTSSSLGAFRAVGDGVSAAPTSSALRPCQTSLLLRRSLQEPTRTISTIVSPCSTVTPFRRVLYGNQTFSIRRETNALSAVHSHRFSGVTSLASASTVAEDSGIDRVKGAVIPEATAAVPTDVSDEDANDDEEEEEEEPRLWFQPEGDETGIMVRNSLTRTKVPLIVKDKILTWYMCGPTVYDDAHIGHASCYVRFDVIRRILTEYFGLDVVIVMGITDIDDKIIARSKILDQSPTQLAKHYESRFLSDLRSLDVSPPSFMSRVSEFIPNIIDFIQTIMDRGHAYHANGSVYFDVASFDGKEYPRLMAPPKITTQDENPTAATSPSTWQSIKNIKASEKKNALDFALWKAAKEGEPGWESPWGMGRPGWHIECSAMGSRVFGSKIDFHSGGIDLMFPHHENEITQCHAYHRDCDQWVNYWLHAGHLTLEDDEEKMSKSLGNTVSIETLLDNYTANQFRMFCLMSRYRSTMRFSSARIQKAVELCHSVSSFIHISKTFIHGKHNCGAIDTENLNQVFTQTKVDVGAALADDFDTPTAMRHLLNLVHEGYVQLSRKPSLEEKSCDDPEARRLFIACAAYITRILQILGISLEGSSSSSSSASDARFSSVMDSLVLFRSAVREFALSTPEVGVEAAAAPLTVEEASLTEALVKKRRKAQMRKERQPLLAACDSLRENLAAQGLQIVDQTKNRPDLKSTWKMTETKGKKQG